MPLNASTRNAIVNQIETAFAHLEAGNIEAVNAMIHDAFEFTTGGLTYIFFVSGGGVEDYPYLVMRLKKKPNG